VLAMAQLHEVDQSTSAGKEGMGEHLLSWLSQT